MLEIIVRKKNARKFDSLEEIHVPRNIQSIKKHCEGKKIWAVLKKWCKEIKSVIKNKTK